MPYLKGKRSNTKRRGKVCVGETNQGELSLHRKTDTLCTRNNPAPMREESVWNHSDVPRNMTRGEASHVLATKPLNNGDAQLVLSTILGFRFIDVVNKMITKQHCEALVS